MGLKLSRHYPIVHQFDEDAIQDRNPYFIVFATGIQGWRPSTVRLDGKQVQSWRRMTPKACKISLNK